MAQKIEKEKSVDNKIYWWEGQQDIKHKLCIWDLALAPKL